MSELVQSLSLGKASFEKIRQGNCRYVDKTDQLIKLVETKETEYCFLSRPRRFGKSLTISTLEAMFQGRVDLFKGLVAENWVANQSKCPTPVLHLDMSGIDSGSAEIFREDLKDYLRGIAKSKNMVLESNSPVGMLRELIYHLQQNGLIAVLIDEYDAPILKHITDPEEIKQIRSTLQSFYKTLKSNEDYLRFVMITGCTKFSKMGIFSALNNLKDISMNPKWGTIVGWTQKELADNFAPWLEKFAANRNISQNELLEQMKDYYDGFSFDGENHVYNPWSVMNCLDEQEFADYWYESGTPSYLMKYLEKYGIGDPRIFSNYIVDRNFTDATEIEDASLVSFLYQAGYLTIKERSGSSLTLDYPNKEVYHAIFCTILKEIYGIENPMTIGDKMQIALKNQDFDTAYSFFNQGISVIPYEIIEKAKQTEAFYHAIFMMLLYASSIRQFGEIQTHKGRSDIVVTLDKYVYVIEFKFGKNQKEAEKLRKAGLQQIFDKDYCAPYIGGEETVIAISIVIDTSSREALPWLTEVVHSA